MKRIFVGGLSSDTTEEDLKDYFEQFGAVSIIQYGRKEGREGGRGKCQCEHDEVMGLWDWSEVPLCVSH